ncbi:YceD family protein [Dasania sp. GY-MA-18]|nr:MULTISPECIES: YceD family protein [Dasania]MCR8921949.1 YceD family protein [Dasania sp. GY-MA-18]MCZ0868105.1 YceD family protein [Dasania phycosphaerae]
MPRLTSLLANDEGLVTAELQFYIDEGRKRRIDGKINAHVNVVCQRCLDAVAIDVVSEFNLAIVWTDDQAKQLPKTLDPLIVGEELTDLAEIVEEELILSLPIVSYHELDSCKQVTRSFGEAEAAPVKEEPKDNPFKVLEQLRSDK